MGAPNSRVSVIRRASSAAKGHILLLEFSHTMARKKNGFLSDGSDSDGSGSEGSDGGYNSQEDADSKAERALFEYSGRKRKRNGGGKASAWEGVFGDEEEGSRGLGSKGRTGGTSGRTDWTRSVDNYCHC